MKKTIFIIVVMLIGCGDNVTISKEEYKNLKGIKERSFIVNEQKYEIYEGSDGHDYYETLLGTGGYSKDLRHFHYPDCKKCIRRDSL